jgi:hypothetical protein
MVRSRYRPNPIALAVMFAFVMLTSHVAFADSLTLAWDQNQEPNVIGYYVYIGTAPGRYSSVIDVGPTTTYTFPSAQPGVSYYMTVAAYIAGPLVGPRAPEVVAASGGGAPTLVNPGSKTSALLLPLTLALSATDPDHEVLTFSAFGLPFGLSINPVTGVISGAPQKAGIFDVAVTVSDTSANFTTQRFTWSVVATDTNPPVIAITSPTGPSYTTTTAFVTLTGVASDDSAVSTVAWRNSLGGSGLAAGTTTWSVVIPVSVGTNVLTMTATDSSGKAAAVQLTVVAKQSSTPLAVTAISADKAAPQAVGTTITFKAIAAGGTGPYQFKWWLFDGTSWQITQEWSQANTFAWRPTIPNSGYQVRVWARSATSVANAPDNYASIRSMVFPIALKVAAP